MLPAPPAHGEAAGRGRAPWTARGGRHPHAAARLPRLPRARPQRARRPDRLRRRAEGGVPARDAVRDAARHDGVGRDGRGRAGTCSSTSTRTRPCARSSAPCRRESAPTSTAAATPERAFATCSIRTLRSHENRGNRTRLRRPAAGGRVSRGGPRGGRRRRRPAPRPGDRRGDLGHRGHPVRAAAGGRRAADRLDALRGPGARRGGDHRRPDAALAEPRARPRPARVGRTLARGGAAARPARRARVDHLPGHDARAARAAARGVGPRRGRGLQRGVLARARRSRPHRLHAAQHAEGRGRPDGRLPRARARALRPRSATTSCRSRRPTRPR